LRDDTPVYDVGWLALAASSLTVPGGVEVVKKERAHWQNSRLRFRGKSRVVTAAQRREIFAARWLSLLDAGLSPCAVAGRPSHRVLLRRKA